MWTFEQSTGKQIDPSGVCQGIGYAGGDCGLAPYGINNPAYEGVADVGPLPCGNYFADYMVAQHPKLGAFAVHLAPDDATRARIIAYGRDPDSFFWHGDSIGHSRQGSDGCIVGIRAVRIDMFWNGADHDLQVVPGPAIAPVSA
jgi:hypothetical protein